MVIKCSIERLITQDRKQTNKFLLLLLCMVIPQALLTITRSEFNSWTSTCISWGRCTDSPLNPEQDWNLGINSIWKCADVWSYWIWIFRQANKRFYLFDFWTGRLLTHAFQRTAIKWYYSYRPGFTIDVMTSSETYSLMLDPFRIYWYENFHFIISFII